MRHFRVLTAVVTRTRRREDCKKHVDVRRNIIFYPEDVGSEDFCILNGIIYLCRKISKLLPFCILSIESENFYSFSTLPTHYMILKFYIILWLLEQISSKSTRCNRGFYCRSYCLLNMFRAPICPSSEAQEYYTVFAACGISCCGFQVAGLVWS